MYKILLLFLLISSNLLSFDDISDHKDTLEVVNYNAVKYNKTLKTSSTTQETAILFESDEVKMVEISSLGRRTTLKSGSLYDSLGNVFEFLPNNKLLITIQSSSSSCIAIIDIDNLKMKLISGDEHYKIKQLNGVFGIYTSNIKSYYISGGAWWYSALYDFNGNLITCIYDDIDKPDAFSFKKVIEDWDYAHNEKDINLLRNMYASEVNYYQKKSESKKNIIIDKQRLFIKSPTFKQTSNIEKIIKMDDKHFELTISKEVNINNHTSIYNSKLVFELDAGTYLIIKEVDNKRVLSKKMTPEQMLQQQADYYTSKLPLKTNEYTTMTNVILYGTFIIV